jgi:hypothetical protein
MPAHADDQPARPLPVDGRKEARLLAIVTGTFFVISLVLTALAD